MEEIVESKEEEIDENDLKLNIIWNNSKTDSIIVRKTTTVQQLKQQVY